MGEELKALVMLRDPASPPDPTEVIGFCRERLSHYKCPRTVEFVDDGSGRLAGLRGGDVGPAGGGG